MNTNTFKSILFVSLTICCFSNKHVNSEIEKLNAKSTESQQEQGLTGNLSVQAVYYKENPWDFIEKNLMIHPGTPEEAVIILDIFTLMTTCLTAFALAVSMELVFEAMSGNYYENSHKRIFFGIPTIVSLVTGALTTIAIHKCISVPPMKRYDDLISILDNYDPDLTKLENNNTKNYIPKELHLTFDALWNIYKQKGEAALKNDWDKVADFIHDKIFFDIKPAKYIKPEVNTHVTVYR